MQQFANANLVIVRREFSGSDQVSVFLQPVTEDRRDDRATCPRLSRVIRPLCSSMIFFTMARPNLYPYFGLVVT